MTITISATIIINVALLQFFSCESHAFVPVGSGFGFIPSMNRDVPAATTIRREDKLFMNWFDSLISKDSKEVSEKTKRIQILENIGSGSYGTVHKATFSNDDSGKVFVAKRAWTLEELRKRPASTHREGDTPLVDEKTLQGRADRCKYYLDVEQHCLEKITAGDRKNEVRAPKLVGKFKDGADGNEWLLFESITKSKYDKDIALSLKKVMSLDWIEQHREDDGGDHQRHHLYLVGKELGLDEDATFEDILDAVLIGLLKATTGVHRLNVVHRDIKPDNLLIDGERKDFVVIDFGSAQDVDVLKTMIFQINGEASVALSPIYAAPECFIDWDKAPLNFDVFSVGLVFCQLLFNLLDDVTDAGFRQQLEDANFDLDIWMERELQATLRPSGIEDGLQYLGNNPGLWNLLGRMLEPKPTRRISSSDALKVATEILSDKLSFIEERRRRDGTYFNYVIDDLEICAVPPDLDIETEQELPGYTDASPRPLHFVASFDRSEPLGLILAEADAATDDDKEYVNSEAWNRAIICAKDGDVFIRDIVPGGQAERIGVFEIGDHLAGVGEFPLPNANAKGFTGFLDMLKAVPERSSTVKIHFDRKVSTVDTMQADGSEGSNESDALSVVAHGAWSSLGKRKTQEDCIILHEISTNYGDKILLSGVLDGHGGNAASMMVSQMLPSTLSSEIRSNQDIPLKLALDTSWDLVCDAYRNSCMTDGDECVAKYDAKEGILYAGIGSSDLLAGCTATIAATVISNKEIVSKMAVLNCGDSRTLIVGKPLLDERGSFVHFHTKDHVPSRPDEALRLRSNPDYADPECSMNKFWLKVGDYRYAVSRSLEGPLATSKGITSESDLSDINISNLAKSRSQTIIIQASDGLFEVLDNEEVARDASAMRQSGLTAHECAKALCKLAIQKGTTDNVTVLVVYLK